MHTIYGYPWGWKSEGAGKHVWTSLEGTGYTDVTMMLCLICECMQLISFAMNQVF